MSFCEYGVLDLVLTERNLLIFLLTKIVFSALTAFLFFFLISFKSIKIFKLIGMRHYIKKNRFKLHNWKNGVPTMGGLLVIISVFLSVSLWGSLFNFKLWIVCFSVVAFGLIGFIDDYMIRIYAKNRGLAWKKKILLQVLVAITVVFLISLCPEYNSNIKSPFSNGYFPFYNLFYFFLLVFIIVGSANSVNITDGLDGLSTLVVIVIKFVFMLILLASSSFLISYFFKINYSPDNYDLVIYCSSFIGALLGFLWFNFYPAEIFIGNTGSLSIGASIAVLSILVKQEFLLVFLGGILVIETISVIIQLFFLKIVNGKRLFKMAPIHHHFELCGLSEPKVVSRFFIISTIAAFISILTMIF